jgi:2'-5' RNA ligase
MRLFFAVTLSEEMIEKILAAQDSLRADLRDDGIRWTKPEQFHYTLKFLGEQPLDRAYQAIDAAQAVREAERPFTLALGGVGAFPNNSRPGVLWLGATEGGEELSGLAARLDKALSGRKFPAEKQPVKAHLTLARIRSYRGEAAVARALKTLQIGEIGRMTVNRFVLMQSVLKPAGSEYTVIEAFRFG